MNKKRIIASLLSIALFASFIPAFAAQNDDAQITGAIKATLRFDYPQLLTKVQEKNINVTLYNKDGDTLVNVPIDGEISGEISENVTAVMKNTYGTELTNESEIGYFDVDIASLPLGEYQFEFTGDGYIPYKTPSIKLDDFSQQIIVGTGDKTFSIGDVDKSGKVDKKDRDVITDALGKTDDKTLAVCDLNGDNKIDIIDLAYVNHQLSATGDIQVFDTELIAARAVNVDEIAEKLTVTGNVENIFVQNNTAPVQIEPKDKSEDISIPINFEKTTEIEQIEVIAPDTAGAPVEGSATVTYIENGEEVTEDIPFNYELPSGIQLLSVNENAKSVVISLGKRVAVKKVIIHVTKVEGSDGKPAFAVVQEVKFLKEILPENPVKQSLSVKGVTAHPLSESVSLSWDEFPNITGYKVYYGEKSGALTKEMTVDVNSARISGLKNLRTYYFKVTPISEDWEGGASEIVSAMPMPNKAPMRPDMLVVTPMDGALSLSWKTTEDATFYRVFYKEATADKFTQFGGDITETKVSIGNLTNKTEYILYVIAGNSIGLSPKSLEVSGIPDKLDIEAPKIPTLHMIDRDNIESIVMGNKNNVLASEYPNGFSVWNVADGDYGTHWTARVFWESNNFTFTFKEAKEMNYMVYVPRLDGKYRRSLEKYSIAVWDEEGNQKQLVSSKNIAINSTTTGYMILPFEKTKVKKLAVSLAQWAGSPTGVSLAEAIFYESDNLASDVRELFANNTYTALTDAAMTDKAATQQKIESLRAQANDADGYYVDKDILLDELTLAEKLLNGESDAIKLVKTGVQSRRNGADSSKYGQAGSDLQPLGAVAYATSKVTIYADIPEGETVTVVPTQYYAEANAWQGAGVTLQNGRNVIEIPKIGSQTSERGGSLYIKYSGSHPEQVSLQARMGITPIPTLELSDWYKLTESERKEIIGEYVDTLESHTKKYKMTQTGIYNSTEISMPNVLLSVAAAPVLSAIKPTGADRDASINTLYNNVLAWEDLMHICNTTQGIDNTLENSDMQSRQNIRYMRMFAKAFMYAAGNHIGIGYGSVSGTACGKPISMLGENATSNKLFGWGIAHEIGHNMDKLGKAEITNNIYSLMAQTYDGKQNTLASRLEKSNKYAGIYKKVAEGRPGLSNDVFVQLGMYWQLHLAYDDGENPMNFYNKLFKEWKSGKISASSSDEKFALAASKVANKNLTEFFEKWGMKLSDSTKAVLAAYPEETRKIQYLCDNSRRSRLNGEQAAEGTTTASSALDGENEKQVNLTFQNDASSGTILGYEIKRNGKVIAFSTKNSYSDVLGSANNMAFRYSVQAIDILGNKVGEEADAGQVRISYVKTISKSAYTEIRNGDGSISVTMNKQTAVSGVKITNAPESGTYEISITRDVKNDETEEITTETVIAKNGDFAKNETPKESYYVSYFNKPGTDSSDTRIWTYDAKEIVVKGVPADAVVEFISYAGDNIAFNDDAVVGHLAHDYVYGEGEDEVIKEGTLIVTGTYRGDPLYNTIQINGKFITVDDESEKETDIERAIDGYSLLFAEIPEDGEVSDISDGIFIFVPNVQKEAALQNAATDCTAQSLLPAQIKAVLYRTDDMTDTESKRMTSDTIWIDSPSESSMPSITLE